MFGDFINKFSFSLIFKIALSDFFCINAGSALYISGLAKNYAQGFEMAKESLARGKAREKFLYLREIQGCC